MVISINPLCSCNEIPQFAALQPPKVHTQRLQKALSLSFLYFGYLFFISCFLCHISTLPKYISKGCTQIFLSLSFLLGGYLFFISCFFMPHFNLSKVHIQRLHKTLSLSLFFRFVYSCLCSCLLMSHFYTITFLTFHFMFLFL